MLKHITILKIHWELTEGSTWSTPLIQSCKFGKSGFSCLGSSDPNFGLLVSGPTFLGLGALRQLYGKRLTARTLPSSFHTYSLPLPQPNWIFISELRTVSPSRLINVKMYSAGLTVDSKRLWFPRMGFSSNRYIHTALCISA